jgi:DNA-binding transcriptional LysR family regulator
VTSHGLPSKSVTMPPASWTSMTAPALALRPLADAFGLVTVPPPIQLPKPPIVCGWHQRFDTDPAHAWLRDRVRAAFTAILTG